MTEKEKQFNQWFDEYADGVKVFEEADMKQAYLQGRAELEKENKVLAQNLEDTEIINKALEKENAELKKKKLDLQDAVTMQMYTNKANKEIADKQLTKAKEIILRLYNAGRDVLMCRAEEKAYDNLSNAINDKSIAQFLNEAEK